MARCSTLILAKFVILFYKFEINSQTQKFLNNVKTTIIIFSKIMYFLEYFCTFSFIFISQIYGKTLDFRQANITDIDKMEGKDCYRLQL